MIRISLISKHYKQIEPLIQQFFNDLQIEYKLTNYTHQTIQDIYFVEIEKKNDLNIFIVGYASSVVGIIKNRLQMANDRFSRCLHE